MKNNKANFYKVILTRQMCETLRHDHPEELKKMYDATEHISDVSDLATMEMLRNLTSILTAKRQQSIQEMHDALERIDRGIFGQCEDCGQPISEKRLAAYPTTTLCVLCKQKREHIKGRIEPSIRRAMSA
jgi:DnaK suppressor protein